MVTRNLRGLFSRPWFGPLAIGLLALALRLTYFEQIRDSPFFEHPVYDASDYASWAGEIAAGDVVWDEPILYPPGYPFFLAAVSALTGHDLPAMTFANAILGSAWIVLLVLAVRRMFSPPAAALTGVLAAAYWPFLHFEAHLLAETLFMFLSVLALFLLIRLGGRDDGVRAIVVSALAGFALGLAAITRPNAVASLPFLAVLLAWPDAASGGGFRPGRRALLRRALPFLAAFTVVVTPVMARNWQVSGMFALRHHLAFNVWLGNRPDAPGYHSIRPGRDWDARSAEPERVAGARTLQDHEAYYRGLVRDFVRERPGEFVRLQVRKVELFLNAHEIRVIMSPYFFERWAPLQASPLLPGFGFIGPLAIVGLVGALAVRPRPWLLLAFAIPQALTVVVTVMGSRYRLPVVPFLLPFAAWTIVAVGGWIRRREWRPLAVVIPALALAAWFVNRDLPDLVPERFGEEMARVAFVQERAGDPASALEWWVAALQEEPERIETYVGLAGLALDQGDLGKAEQVTRAGLARAPQDPDLLALRGRAFLLAGEADSAAKAFESALQAEPGNPVFLADLGRARYDQGRVEEAIAAFQGAIAGPDPPSAVLLDAALVLEEAGRARSDPEFLRKAADLLEHILRDEPDHAEARRRLAALREAGWLR